MIFGDYLEDLSKSVDNHVESNAWMECELIYNGFDEACLYVLKQLTEPAK